MRLVEYKEEEHYELLKGWWNAHGWDGVHPGILKPVAYFMENDGELVVFAVLWPVSEASVCIMEWVVSNPDAKPMTVFKCLRELTKFYEGLCRENNYGILLTTCKQEGLAKVHVRNGFERCDDGMIHLAKVIGD